jgi:hypothetical protein
MMLQVTSADSMQSFDTAQLYMYCIVIRLFRVLLLIASADCLSNNQGVLCSAATMIHTAVHTRKSLSPHIKTSQTVRQRMALILLALCS